MPVKARYWADPEKWKASTRLRRKANVYLGYKGGQRVLATYLKGLEYRKAKHKIDLNYRSSHAQAERNYRRKVNMAGFTTDSKGIYFYARTKGTLKDGYNPKPKYDEEVLSYAQRHKGSRATKRSPMPAHLNSGLNNNLLRRKPRKKRNPGKKRIRRR